MDLPVSSTCSVLLNLFINYQVYWKTLVNVNSVNVMLMYTLHITHQAVLESKSAYINLAIHLELGTMASTSAITASRSGAILHAVWSYTEV